MVISRSVKLSVGISNADIRKLEADNEGVKSPASGFCPEGDGLARFYGYPLIQYASSFESVISEVGTNGIFSESNIATPEGAAIVRPNVDTLWSNNFANLGTLTETKSGKYLLQLADEPSKVGFEPSEGRSEYLGYINFPTVYGPSIPRILLFNDSLDVTNVNRIQCQIKIEEIPRAGFGVAPRLTNELLGNGALLQLALQSPGALNKTSAQKLLTTVARVAAHNMPVSSIEAARVNKLFETAGLSKGTYNPPVETNFTLANQLIQVSFIMSENVIEPFNNDWIDFIPEVSGNFHTQYTIRSYIAFTAYAQLVQQQALYPEYIGSGLLGLSLKANESYILTFPSGKPVVKGFWILTAYNSSNYLVTNPLNRYSLGDRSNLT
ncbi:hypothetical protein ACHAQJ_004074 [Trichoderma viride]